MASEHSARSHASKNARTILGSAASARYEKCAVSRYTSIGDIVRVRWGPVVGSPTHPFAHTGGELAPLPPNAGRRGEQVAERCYLAVLPLRKLRTSCMLNGGLRR